MWNTGGRQFGFLATSCLSEIVCKARERFPSLHSLFRVGREITKKKYQIVEFLTSNGVRTITKELLLCELVQKAGLSDAHVSCKSFFLLI